jgi:hypothetical protein
MIFLIKLENKGFKTPRSKLSQSCQNRFVRCPMYCCYQCLWTVLVVQLRWMMWLIPKSHSSGHTHLPGLDHHNFRHIHGLNLRTTSMAKYLADIRARPRVYRLPASLSHLRQSH